jgi:hypothetical protein
VADEKVAQASEQAFRAKVVATVLDSRPEVALDMLCEHYRVSRPRLKVGVSKGRTKGVLAVYSVRRKEILAVRRETFFDPFVLIHEFYHHLRSTSGEHRGTERQADLFAAEFIGAYKHAAEQLARLSAAGWSWTTDRPS